MNPTDFTSLPPNSLKEKPMTPDHNDPSNAAVKPAYRSTEFWLATTATVIGIVLASGLLSPDDPTQAKLLQVLGLAASILASLGYGAMRTSAKNVAAEAAAALAIEKVRASAAPAVITRNLIASVPADPSDPASQR